MLRHLKVRQLILGLPVSLKSGNFHWGYSLTRPRASPFVRTRFAHFATVPSAVNSIFRLIGGIRKGIGFGPAMDYFVIGVSGVTCGGKTSLTKLLQRKFPWAKLIHQDHYFYDPDWSNHVICKDAENHVNYEIFNALDMDKMYKDVEAILEAPPEFKRASQPSTQITAAPMIGDRAEVPNYDDNFVQMVPEIDNDVSKYEKVPIFIIEGYTIFASEFLYDKCDARLFCSLDKETCRKRRAIRTYDPPDTPSYFDKIVWPEYEKHLEGFINRRSGVTVFDGDTPIQDIWRNSVQIVTCRMEEKYFSSRQESQKGLKVS